MRFFREFSLPILITITVLLFDAPFAYEPYLVEKCALREKLVRNLCFERLKRDSPSK